VDAIAGRTAGLLHCNGKWRQDAFVDFVSLSSNAIFAKEPTTEFGAYSKSNASG